MRIILCNPKQRTTREQAVNPRRPWSNCRLQADAPYQGHLHVLAEHWNAQARQVRVKLPYLEQHAQRIPVRLGQWCLGLVLAPAAGLDQSASAVELHVKN